MGGGSTTAHNSVVPIFRRPADYWLPLLTMMTNGRLEFKPVPQGANTPIFGRDAEIVTEIAQRGNAILDSINLGEASAPHQIINAIKNAADWRTLCGIGLSTILRQDQIAGLTPEMKEQLNTAFLESSRAARINSFFRDQFSDRSSFPVLMQLEHACKYDVQLSKCYQALFEKAPNFQTTVQDREIFYSQLRDLYRRALPGKVELSADILSSVVELLSVKRVISDFLDTRREDVELVYKKLVATAPGRLTPLEQISMVDFLRWERKVFLGWLPADHPARVRHLTLFGTGGDSGPESLEVLEQKIRKMGLDNQDAILSNLRKLQLNIGKANYAGHTLHLSTISSVIIPHYLRKFYTDKGLSQDNQIGTVKVGTGPVTGPTGSAQLRAALHPYYPPGSGYLSLSDITGITYSPSLVAARKRLHEAAMRNKELPLNRQIDPTLLADPYKLFWPLANTSDAISQVTGVTDLTYAVNGMPLTDHIKVPYQVFVYSLDTGCDELLAGNNLIIERNPSGKWIGRILQFGDPSDAQYRGAITARRGRSAQESLQLEIEATLNVLAGNAPDSVLETMAYNAAVSILPIIKNFDPVATLESVASDVLKFLQSQRKNPTMIRHQDIR